MFEEYEDDLPTPAELERQNRNYRPAGDNRTRNIMIGGIAIVLVLACGLFGLTWVGNRNAASAATLAAQATSSPEPTQSVEAPVEGVVVPPTQTPTPTPLPTTTPEPTANSPQTEESPPTEDAQTETAPPTTAPASPSPEAAGSVFDTAEYRALVAHFEALPYVESGLNWLNFLEEEHPVAEADWGGWISPGEYVPANVIIWADFYTDPLPAGVEPIKAVDNNQGSLWGVFSSRDGFTAPPASQGGSWVSATWLVERFTGRTLSATPVPEMIEALTLDVASPLTCPVLNGMPTGEAVELFVDMVYAVGIDSPFQVNWEIDDTVTFSAGWLIGADIFGNAGKENLEVVNAINGWGLFLTTGDVTLVAPLNGGNALYVGTGCNPAP